MITASLRVARARARNLRTERPIANRTPADHASRGFRFPHHRPWRGTSWWTGNACFPCPHFGSQIRAEIICFEHLANLDFCATAEGSALQPLDCFVQRLALPQPKACDQLFRLGEWAVDDRLLIAGTEFHAYAFRRRLQSLGGEQHAGLYQLFVELGHVGENFLIREDSRFGILIRFYYHQEPHFTLSFGLGWSRCCPTSSGYVRLYSSDERRGPKSTSGRRFGVMREVVEDVT